MNPYQMKWTISYYGQCFQWDLCYIWFSLSVFFRCKTIDDIKVPMDAYGTSSLYPFNQNQPQNIENLYFPFNAYESVCVFENISYQWNYAHTSSVKSVTNWLVCLPGCKLSGHTVNHRWFWLHFYFILLPMLGPKNQITFSIPKKVNKNISSDASPYSILWPRNDDFLFYCK